MNAYILRRVLYMLPTIVVPMVLVFLLLRLAPGDPAAMILGDQATITQIEELRHKMGLDRALPIQFLTWAKGVVTLQLGESLFFHKPVLSLLAEYSVVTLHVALVAMVVAVVLGVSLGLLAAMKRDTWVDRSLVAGAVLGISLPEFWFALLLIFLFAVTWPLFPVAGYVEMKDGLWASALSVALPALALGIRQSALMTRMSRSAMVDVLGEPYIVTARAQGLPERMVIGRYALRMAAIPVVTIAGLTASYLISGAVAIEMIFSLPGLGKLLIDAVSRRDYPVVEGVVLTIAVLIALLNLGVVLLYAWLDPRIRLN